jgi:hypothetical protein
MTSILSGVRIQHQAREVKNKTSESKTTFIGASSGNFRQWGNVSVKRSEHIWINPERKTKKEGVRAKSGKTLASTFLFGASFAS